MYCVFGELTYSQQILDIFDRAGEDDGDVCPSEGLSCASETLFRFIAGNNALIV
jgi:hypothetical protein